MITTEQILKAQEEAIKNAGPIRAELEKFKKEYQSKINEFEKPIMDLIEAYYDENLTDKNNAIVQIGMTITNGKSKLYIHSRGMQFIFGHIVFNPRVMGKKIDDKGFIKPNAREIHVHPKELKEYWIL
ncbi:hypothetical protein DBR39_13650 [Chryseobacterium sp. KBW03]|uniref:hypothetical protein n=1 Tax=Chryseobacterium sp. KBW03 TaxID=2153362 RepID=UPI000F5A54F0|nr:hypothetical protein [Chryseobacterium sp. KBW03]RQO37928.1 hypothetical protein DBR39_13650 [Chryseobacterium sp. KBW03]